MPWPTSGCGRVSIGVRAGADTGEKRPQGCGGMAEKVLPCLLLAVMHTQLAYGIWQAHQLQSQ
jgi:hypothetical protein